MAVLDDVESGTGKDNMVVSSAANDDISPELAASRRIRYADDEINEVGALLTRKHSTYSIHSVHSARSASRQIDPKTVLPIQYRTLSYNIDDAEAQRKSQKSKKEAKNKVEDELADLDWHIITEAEISKRLQTDTQFGLSSDQVKDKFAQHGKNVPSPPPSHLGRKLFGYCFGGFGAILLVGAVLVFISWKPLGNPPAQANLALAIVLVVVFVVQAAFNAWQDFSSSRVMKSITGLLPEDCTVLRNGQHNKISAQELVPGDVLLWKAGSKLPADVRFTEVSSDAKFDRSILTGESQPLAAVVDSTDPNFLETRNIGMQGTHCTTGSGMGVVVSTGDHTVFGHIAKLTSTPSTARTPLQVEILRFVFIIIGLMVTMDLVIIGVWAGYIRHAFPGYMPPGTLIVNIVSIAIAFVPEGLPIALTASLTIIANIMRKNNILCKSLKTVETLGAVSVLLSDKTGTLTKNQMTVTDILIGFSTMTTEDAKEKWDKDQSEKAALEQLRIAAAVCNAGEFEPTTKHLPLPQRKIIADATDAAVLRFSETLASTSEARQMWRKRFDLTFNSKNKFAIRVSSPVHSEAHNLSLSTFEAATYDTHSDLVLVIKGAPDVLIPKCGFYVGEDGQPHALEEGSRAAIEKVKDEWSAQGKRVLLLARKMLKVGSLAYDPAHGEFETEAIEQARSGLILIGLVGIVDPPRDEVPSVVNTLRTAGIRTMMVTGDFKLTAQAIARQCGIISVADWEIDGVSALPRTPSVHTSTDSIEKSRNRAIVLSGSDLITLNDNQWECVTHYQEIVFARTTPDQKLRIVKEFRSRNNVVAMTGDGVNDAPSLKEADIGIAPGSGSDIALEAADMVLLTDDFGAIIQAVLYGRTIFDNLRKVIAYLLPAGSFSEFWPVMTSVIFGLPQVLSSFLMIIICCFTDCAAAICLAFEKPEADVLLLPPRNIKKDRLVDWKLLLQSYGLVGMIETLCSFAMSYWYLQRNGITFSSLWFSYGNYSDPPLTSDEISNKLNVASSIYFVNLVVMQWFNVMGLRTRRLSIFQHPPLFKKATQNWYLFPAILFALVIAIIFCYIQGLQSVIGSGDVPVENWFLPMAFGLGLLCIDELRKAGVRRWPGGILAKMSW